MSTHKDLPPGSRKWASEVDADRAELKALREVVRRLSENAGIDMANPKRGVNTGATPSVKSPVGQKLSSLADVGTYDVLDGQVLTWTQKGQKWMPITPTTGGINWRPATENEHMEGYLSIDGDYYSNKVFGQENLVENPSGTGASFGYVGTSDASAYLTAAQRYLGGPTRFHGYVAVHPYYVKIGSVETPDSNVGPWLNQAEIEVGRNNVSLSTPKGLYGDTATGSITLDTCWLFIPRFATADRPVPIPGDEASYKGAMIYDTSLAKPLWWNSVAWCDALGTAV